MPELPIGLQLYTIRDETAKDFLGALRAVAQIGFTGVEFAGTGDLSAPEMRAALDDLGLVSISAHVGIDALEGDAFARTVEYYQTLGTPYLVVPWAKADDSAADWQALGARLDAIGARLAPLGMTLCYHNHAHEFARFDGQYALDLLYAAAQPAHLQAELDLYWVKKGGEEPADYLRNYLGRTPLLHMKDMAPDGDFAEFGTGIIDWDPVLALAPSAGVRWYLVEQDSCKRPCLESVEISFRNLRARLQG